MEVVSATPNGRGVSPFHNHDVREWSRMDSLTGVLERARRETDHWTTNTSNSSHKYGKVVDCRARSGVDGNLQQEARRQLEVFQSQIPGGRLQVIKTHTVSSSRWTNKSPQELATQAFEDLQLSINPLDVTPQKSKASVGRSVGRRPPSRQQRVRNESTAQRNEDTSSVTNLHRVSRLCHQIHDSAVKQYFQRPSIHERQNGDGSVIEIREIEAGTDKNEQHAKLTRTKSTSSEDLHVKTPPEQQSSFSNESEKSTKSIEDLEDLEQLRSWRRTSKIRRSLQFPAQNKIACKPPDLPENNGSVRRIREDLEKGRRLNTALRGNNVDLEALDQILRSISSPYMEQKRYEEAERDTPEKEENEEEEEEESIKKPKRNSFVTVESIKEVRNRLRRTSSPITNIYRDNKEDPDDGIVTEDAKMPLSENNTPSKVRSYVHDMENSLTKKSINGTGSLESRQKHLNSNSVNRNEDWYNRRKSYGFEKMHNHQEDTISKIKNTESSTDSGICRSSEIVVPSSKIQENLKSNEYNYSSDNIFHNTAVNLKEDNVEGTTITIPIVSKSSPLFNTRKLFERELGDGTSYSVESWREGEDIKRHSIAVDESKYVTKYSEPKFRRTSLAINSNDVYLDNEDDNFFHGRKPKKVEFCKTEVHFAAESGKVNIVETDEKPPPTNNFRRRRRNSGLIVDEFNSNGLPVFQFGDDILNNENGDADNGNCNLHNGYYGLVTVNSNTSNNVQLDFEEDQKENFDSEIRKGILKNKPIKPKPYILGDNENYLSNDLNLDNKQWDIKTIPHKDETPIWRSTVTVRNTYFDDSDNSVTNNGSVDVSENFSKGEKDLPEFQKLLKNLKPVTKRPESFCETPTGDSYNGIRILSPNIDTRRSSWSVADRVKLVEDLKLVENKGYSTKINFGNGEATVIENNNKQVNRHPTWPRREETSSDLDRMQNVVDVKPKRVSKSQLEKTVLQENHSNNHRNKISEKIIHSPKILRKTVPLKPTADRPKFEINKLSSPRLVGQNAFKSEIYCDNKFEEKSRNSAKMFLENSDNKKGSLDRQAHKKTTQHVSPSRIRNKSPSKEVLRQPKKSEMAYFGIPVSPRPVKKQTKENKLSEKPDLLQFTNDKKKGQLIHESKDHIYENIDNIKKQKSSSLRRKREFDSSILEELTRAADQILQAVNGYTDEDSQNKFSTDDEEKRKNNQSREPLDTISETRSWRQNKTSNIRAAQSRNSNAKTKLKQTSSNSSIESVSREVKKPIPAQKLSVSASNTEQRIRRKISSSDSASTKANTKARRLQRASSREALLQSHGSSSEDLPAVVEVPLRKPRLVRKTKSSQLTVTNGLELKTKSVNSNRRKEDNDKSKTDNRVPTIGLPEIRHKTAISTIRSTAEKAATREKCDKWKATDSKKKPIHKRESRGSGMVKNDKAKSPSSRESTNQRISTANIKKCSRYEASFK